jgi:hypothetical protein
VYLSGCEIHVGRGDGKGSVLLTIDTVPDYVDTQPFPATKTVWSYKAIFRADDAQVGQWSKVVSGAVGGLRGKPKTAGGLAHSRALRAGRRAGRRHNRGGSLPAADFKLPPAAALGVHKFQIEVQKTVMTPRAVAR